MPVPDEATVNQAFAEALKEVGLSETAQGAVVRVISLFREGWTGKVHLVLNQGGCRGFEKTESLNGTELSIRNWSIT